MPTRSTGGLLDLVIHLFSYSVAQLFSAPAQLDALRASTRRWRRYCNLIQRHLHECQRCPCLALPSGSPIEPERFLRAAER